MASLRFCSRSNASTTNCFPALRRSSTAGQIVFRQGKYDGDGLQLSDHQQSGGIVRAHDISGIHKAEPHPPADGRRDAGNRPSCSLALSICPWSGLDDPYVLTHQGFLRIDLLLRNVILFVQVLIALQI